MNIFKNKKFIATVLAFVMVMTLAGLPLAARERRGTTVVVTMTNGSIKGELLAVKADVILVYDQNARQGKSLDLQQVLQVNVLKKSKFGQGLLIGLGVGVGILIASGSKWPYPGQYNYNNLQFPLITSLFGGVLGAITSESEQFTLAGAPPSILWENLQRLKRHAREVGQEETVGHASSDSLAFEARPRRKFFNRLRLIWMPVIRMPSTNISSGGSNGTFRFVESNSSKDTGIYDFNPFAKKEYVENINNRRFQLEYEWTYHVSIGLEYVSRAQSKNWYRYNLSFVSADFNRSYTNYRSREYIEYSYSSWLLGLNWKPLQTSLTSKQSIELGIAAGPARVGEKTYGHESLQSNISTWMAKVQFAYDYYYNDNLSLGGFIELQHLSAQFSGVRYIETQLFNLEGVFDENTQLKRQTEITIPDHKTQLGGLAYGLRIGLHF